MVVEIDQSRNWNLLVLFLFAFGKCGNKAIIKALNNVISNSAYHWGWQDCSITAEYSSWPTSIGGLLFILSKINTYIFYLALETKVRYRYKKLRSSNIYQLLRF